MHWLTGALAVAASIAGWRWVLRPGRRAWRELLLLLRQIRDASGGVQRLARDVEALSGAVVQLCTQLLDRQAEHQARLDDITELYVDLSADVARLKNGEHDHDQ